LHEAAGVKDGVKYILRTEIIFERVSSAIDAYQYQKNDEKDDNLSIQNQYFNKFPSWKDREEDEAKKYLSYELFSNALIAQRENSNLRYVQFALMNIIILVTI
jgi:hypothetical protein